ncbi:CU044_5270 family protein [Streptomyces sp. GQFP]|uniref:CU044_5270 family protein n=1 Tax=Streptomyces sp. GQFP TaxID=2907545 RepID=UPI001F1D07B0|nr:CU044_5270 family protein [Streptomyces sp. GQFP]UIX32446.1 CU044_5270 family protein [Streptomyces sp. GQFP]
MNEQQHEVLDALDDFDALDFPGADILVAAGEVAPPATGTIDAALAAVRLAAAGEGAATDSKWPRRRFASTRRSRVLLSAAAVAAVVAGAIAVPTIPFGDTPPAAGANAASFLHGVADTAAEAPSTNAPYWKVRARSVHRMVNETGGAPIRPAPGMDLGPTTTTSWTSRSGVIVETSKGEYLRTGVGKEPGAQMSVQVAGMEVKWDDLADLPTEPGALRTFLESGNPATPKDEAVFNGIVQLLVDRVSPEVRSALYEVLAELPYVRLVGPVKDGAGRAGVAIEYDSEDRRTRIVIDPRTAIPLERKNFILGGPADGTAYLTITYLVLESVWKAP